MFQEQGTVVRIEEDALWIETVQQSACGSCSAQKGCGQHALSKALSSFSVIRVLLDGRSAQHFSLNQSVIIAIPEDVIVNGALWSYLLPLVMLMAGAFVGDRVVGSDVGSMVGAAIGLFFGGLVINRWSWKNRSNPQLQPVLLDASQ